MRFDAEEALKLAEELTPPRRAGDEVTSKAAKRLGGLLREAGYRVDQSTIPGESEPLRPLVGFAFVAATAGIVLELSHLSGHSTGPRELALACACLVLVGLLERRIQRGLWGGPRSASIHATDPRAESAPATLVLVTPLETPAPKATHRLGVAVTILQVLWLVLLWLPCLLGDARAWLTVAGPELLQMLAVIALVPGLDSWTRHPRSYPGDNRSGPALAVALARAWPPSLVDRIALELLLEPPLEDNPVREPGPSARMLVVLLDSPGVGNRIQIEGSGPAAELAVTAARELWLPLAASTTGEGGRLASRLGKNLSAPAIAIGANGPMPPDGKPDPKLLQATAQLLEELALRWARAESRAGEAD